MPLRRGRNERGQTSCFTREESVGLCAREIWESD